jgi:peptidoglycan hydrolase-like protein with peptidoglycan-binding domain
MNLRLGMSGAAVKQVQQLLSGPKLYNGPIDSSFGGGMQAAVKSYQKQQGLPITGVVDEAT